MDIRTIVSRGEPENRHLVYVPDSKEKRTIVESLVSLSNSEGGTVVIGAEVDEKGIPKAFTDIAARESIVAEIESELEENVEPRLSCRTVLFRISGSRFVSFTVPPSDSLRSVHDEGTEKPVFPTRTRSHVSYLSGNDIDCFLELSST